MSGNRKIHPEEKRRAVHEYLDGKRGMSTLAVKYGVSCRSFRKWVCKYKTFGESAFVKTHHYASYSEEFKHTVVEAFLAGEGSFEELAIKYKIPSLESVRQWVFRYNSHEKQKVSETGGTRIMTKGRKTTFNERVEIVQYCISHEHNYVETACKYQISYQQARSYTIKYEELGIDGLQDNRGRRKPEEEMSELERLRAENKILKAEKLHAEMEASFLKKLAEIERRRG